MSNDGWCGYNARAVTGLVLAPEMRVTRAPSHGKIDIRHAPSKDMTRVAYRPEPSFTGIDTFTVLDVDTNNEREFVVTVTP
jgi:hypothetical protein